MIIKEIDNEIDKIRENGEYPKFIIIGYNLYNELQKELSNRIITYKDIKIIINKAKGNILKVL